MCSFIFPIDSLFCLFVVLLVPGSRKVTIITKKSKVNEGVNGRGKSVTL